MSIKGLSKEKPDLRLKNKQVDKKFSGLLTSSKLMPM